MENDADAARRTRLANERTYLAWWRGGLTSLAVAVGAGAIAPDLTSADRWPFAALGVAFAALGLAFIVYGARRHRAVEASIRRGGFSPLDTRAATWLAAAGTLLALATALLVVLEAR